MRKLAIRLLCLVAAVVPPAARAASAPDRTDEARLQEADWAFRGVVVQAESAFEPNGPIWTRYVLDVRAWIKPATGPRRVSIKQVGGVVGDLHLDAQGIAHFSIGDDVVLMTKDFGAGWQSVLDGSLGVRRIASESDADGPTGPVSEYTHDGNSNSNLDGRPRFTTFPVTYRFNDQTSDLLPNVSDGSDPRGAWVGSLDTWFGAIQRTYAIGADSSITNGGINDGVNLVTFADTANNRSVVGSLFALTLCYWTANRFTDVDTLFSPTRNFTTILGDTNNLPLQPLSTHEQGHGMGLEHSATVATTMWPFLSPVGISTQGEYSPQTLWKDDVAGVKQNYADAAFDAATGVIEGAVRIGSSLAYGVHVVAMRERDGIVWASNVTLGDNRPADEGRYEIRGLAPDTYVVYAEPIDGPVTSNNWTGNYSGGDWWGAGFTSGFRATWNGGAVSPTPVVVTAGSTTTVDVSLEAFAPVVNPTRTGRSPDGTTLPSSVGSFPIRLVPGQTVHAMILGTGLDVVADNAIRCSDPAVSIAAPTRRGSQAGLPYVIVAVTVPANARGGPRNIEFSVGAELTPFTGALEVVEEQLCGNGLDDDGDSFVDCADADCGDTNPDQDGDHVTDACDACPIDPENDVDRDGRCADVDNCPTVGNPTQADGDRDLLGDACDPCPGDVINDPDGDAICGLVDNCPTIANATQGDRDGDLVGDPCDACPEDPDNDVDADTICGDVDNCPTIGNGTQVNRDGDADGDACDACPLDADDDSDADTVCGDVDNCPDDPNTTQDDRDRDALGDACDACPDDDRNDEDADLVCGDVDNCPVVANGGQEDLDRDGFGDACDPDVDGDGALDAADCAPRDDTAAIAPVEIVGVRVTGSPVLVSWTGQAQLGSSGAYDVIRGRLSALRADRGFARAACHAPGVTGTSVAVAAGTIPPGDGDWYLVRATNACPGGQGYGTWGTSFRGPNARAALDSAPGTPCP